MLLKPFVVATAVGLALAAVCKLVYDAFNGYALAQNVLLGFGITPSGLLMDCLLLLSLAAASYLAGKLLWPNLPESPQASWAIVALPWVALTLFGFVAGALPPSTTSLPYSAPSLLVPLLACLAVPLGLWLSVGRPKLGQE